jgi:hypothetical protein
MLSHSLVPWSLAHRCNGARLHALLEQQCRIRPARIRLNKHYNIDSQSTWRFAQLLRKRASLHTIGKTSALPLDDLRL